MFSTRKRVQSCHSIADLRLAAKRALPRMVFDYVDGGAQTESTMRANQAAFERLHLIASGPVDVSARSTATSLFGAGMQMPLIIGPTGFAGACRPGGDVLLARAAGRFGIPFVVSNGANSSLEDIAEAASGRLWLQVYLSTVREQTGRLLSKARDLGVEAIEVTVDTAVPGRRLRDIASGFGVNFSWNAARVLDVARHPQWALSAARHGTPTLGLMDPEARQQGATISEFVRTQINPALTWDDLKWLRDTWQGPLIVKGLTDPGQIPQTLATGYDGIVVSNHGGRQLDCAVPVMDVLPEFVSACTGQIPVLIDSGFRTGTDVLKAMALGANAVQLGRSTLYGLAAGGQEGVERALSIFQTELDIAMALTGLNRVDEASPKLLRQSAIGG